MKWPCTHSRNPTASPPTSSTIRCCANSFFQMGMLEFEMEDCEKGVADLLRAFEIASQEGDSSRMLNIAGTLANDYYALKEYDQALEYFAQAYEQARTQGDHKGECTFLTEMGNAALAKGDARNAVKHYDQALVIASSLENRGSEINIIGGLFRAYSQLNEPGLTTYYGEKAIQLAAEIQHFDAQINNIFALGTYYAIHSDYEQALKYFNQGRELATQNNNQEWLLTIEVSAGMASFQSGDYPAAHEAYTRALTLAGGFADRLSQARILGYLAAVRAEQEMLPESIEYARQSLDLALELEETALAGEQQMLLAFNYQDVHNMDLAVQYCQAAVASYQSIEAADMVERAQTLLAELKQDAGD